MIKKLFTLAFLLAGTTLITAQEKTAFLEIGGDKISLEEFERVYRKNNNEKALSRQTPEDYLELFINFKLKVREAESLGMDTTKKFVDELEGYRKQLAKPYLTDKESKQEMVKEAYERMKEDLKASHILIKLPPSPAPEDTLAAYQKIMEIRDRILKGESFETVARATSEDASVARNGGNLGYFTAFSMIYSFENMAYRAEIGKVTMPFRTSYGYHILRLDDRRPARGQVKVAHIFIRTPEAMQAKQKKAARERATAVYDSIRLGADFGSMARKYSEDPASSQTGGEIPWFGTGRMIPEFENACFGISEKGGVSEPFQSNYGWHIVKLLDKKGIGSFEEMRPEIEEKINRGDRARVRSHRFLAQLKQEYAYSVDTLALQAVYAAADSSLLQGKWEAGKLRSDKRTAFRIGEKELSVGDFAAYVEQRQTRSKCRLISSCLDELLSSFGNDMLMKYEENRLAEKYPDFKYIYQEYHDGILLFDIMDQKVWSKAVSDTSGLEAFHAAHRNDYMWGERSEAILVSFDKRLDAARVMKLRKKIARGKLDQQALNALFCAQDSLPCISLRTLLVEKGENEQVDALKGKPGPGKLYEGEETNSFVILKGQRAAEPKALDEARGQITSDYQNYLEELWVKALRSKYPVRVDRSRLKSIKL